MDKRFKFTQAKVAAIEPPADVQRVEYRDTQQSGLTLVASRAGSKTFYLVRWHDGRHRRIKLGSFVDLTVADARDIARLFIKRLLAGEDPKRRCGLTLGDAFDSFLESHAKPRKKSWREDERTYRLHLAHLARRRLDDIDREEAQRIRHRIGEVRGAPVQANRVMHLLSMLFTHATDELGFQGANPARRTGRYREHPRERFIGTSEMPAFLEAVEFEAVIEPPAADFIRLALYTGARRANVEHMAWADVDLAERVWTIPAEQAKSGRTLRVPLVSAAVDVLGRRSRRAGTAAEASGGEVYVMPGRRRGKPMGLPRAAWDRALARAGIGDLRFHDLRRTLGSWMAMTGASELVIGRALGHAVAGVTGIYARLELSPVRFAMERAVDAMHRAGGGAPADEHEAPAVIGRVG